MTDAYQQAMDTILGRTRAAHGYAAWLLQQPVHYDAQRIADIISRWEQTSPGPWITQEGEYDAKNWLVGSFGSDYEGMQQHVTTDGVHASEMVTGGAKEDAQFVAHSWADILYLVRLVQSLRYEEVKRHA